MTREMEAWLIRKTHSNKKRLVISNKYAILSPEMETDLANASLTRVFDTFPQACGEKSARTLALAAMESTAIPRISLILCGFTQGP
jgi:hypothetical protein